MVREAGVFTDGQLAHELAVALGPELQDALNHPTRREVLRVLHRSGRSCGVPEILDRLSPLKRDEVVYHVRVLEAAGAIVADGTQPAFGGRDVLYRSVLVDEGNVVAALQATERSDRERRQGASGGSPGLLTMFRVPRPGRILRLGERKAGEGR